MRNRDPVAARERFAEAVKLDPSYASAWANLGAVALAYRDYPAAEQAYEKAVALILPATRRTSAAPGRWTERRSRPKRWPSTRRCSR